MFDYNKYFQCSKNAKYIVCMCKLFNTTNHVSNLYHLFFKKKMFIMKIKIKDIGYKNYF